MRKKNKKFTTRNCCALSLAKNEALSGNSIPIRIKGGTTSGGKGIAGVAVITVTGGLRFTNTDRDGSRELVTDGRKPFACMTIPAG